MDEPRYGQRELEQSIAAQNAAIAAKEKAEREKQEADAKKKERLRDEIRFWIPIVISVISLIVSIVK